MNLSTRVHAIKESPTIAVTDKARRLREAGHNVIGLGAGEPDFDTADFVLEAAKAAMDAGETRYTAVDGTPAVKEAIIDKMKRDHDLEYRASEIVVSSGGKNSLYNLVQAVVDAGDEAIVPAPYWVSYTDIVLLAGGVPVVVETDASSGFKMAPEQLEAAITPRTRLLILNSPSNPTGACYRRSELAALAEVLRRHPGIVVATDDMYEKIMWDDEPFANVLTAAPDLKDRTVVLNGVSKAYAMTGFRIGYAAAPRPVERRDAQDPVAVHLQPLLGLPGGGGGGDLRRPCLCRGAKPHLPRTPRLREPAAERARGGELRAGQGRVLRLPRLRGGHRSAPQRERRHRLRRMAPRGRPGRGRPRLRLRGAGLHAPLLRDRHGEPRSRPRPTGRGDGTK